MLPKLVIFDIDNTLTRSKQPVTADMAVLLEQLACITEVAFISGGTLEQLLVQVAEHLSPATDFSKIHILPTSGGALYDFKNGSWEMVYEERLTDAQAQAIAEALKQGAIATGLIDFSDSSYGNRIEARGAQVTLSALGQEAPIDQKTLWDPTGEKRHTLREAIAALLPDYDVKQGGATSIDVTKKGINKAYGIRALSTHAGIPIVDMLYVGDALFEGGNDAVVKETGIKTHAVEDPDDTQRFIRELIREIQ